MKKTIPSLEEQIKRLPTSPGVYLFKDDDNHILYVGKAKNIKKRVQSYLIHQKSDMKAAAILTNATHIDHLPTPTELDALLAEATLIKNHQPKYNVLLKTGHPFLFLMVTTQAELPELQIVRMKKKKGLYFGPFLDKHAARKVYEFFTKTFRLKICGKKIANGCLYYHLGQCAGSCKDDFDVEAYKERLNLAITALQKGHADFLEHLQLMIDESNKAMTFEKSQELATYYKAFEKTFAALTTLFSSSTATRPLTQKDIWVLSTVNNALYLFKEENGMIKKHHTFFHLLDTWFETDTPTYDDYLVNYYRSYTPPQTIVGMMPLADAPLIEHFIQQWAKVSYPVTLITTPKGHLANVVALAQLQADRSAQKQRTTPLAIQRFLQLPKPAHTVDCFDISHKQGTTMVGSCVRFTDGEPDKKMFRHFHIKTLDQQNDYAALREIVERRYKGKEEELPDLILIDGGKGQLNAVSDLYQNVAWASLAKREETVFSKDLPPDGKKISPTTFVGQVLIAVRDYTHHFAISFHRKSEKL